MTDGPAHAGSRAERFRAVASGHVCDALEHVGILTPVLDERYRPLTRLAAFAGPAVTLRLSRARTGNESRRLTDLVEDAVATGDVVVIDAHGLIDSAVFGDRAAFVAQRAGAVAAVVNGGVRDVDGLDELDFPVHAVARALPASEGRLAGIAVNGEVVLDGVLVAPGDWLVGDSSGICVVPADRVDRVLELAEEREEIDRESFEGLRAGKTLRDVHRHFKDDDVARIRASE